VIVTGPARPLGQGAAVAAGSPPEALVDDLTPSSATPAPPTGARAGRRARPGRARPDDRRRAAGRRVRRVVLRTTDALTAHRERRGHRARAGSSTTRDDLSYAQFLTWRGFLRARATAPAGARPPRRAAEPAHDGGSSRWSAAGRDRVRAPAAGPGEHGHGRHRPHGAGAHGRHPATIATFTVDRLAFSLSPRRWWRPSSTSTAADGSSASSPTSTRTPCKIGDRVEMTFRRLYTVDGIHNYFWKARPVRSARGTDMASHGIRDKVAIIGMGCTTFGEHWDKSTDDLLIDASSRRWPRPASTSTTSTRSGSARWARACRAHAEPAAEDRPQAGHPRRELLRHRAEAFRNACYAVASGAYDVAMAIGVEKLKDSGLLGARRAVARRTTARPPQLTAPASFSFLAPAYAKKYGVDDAGDEGRDHPHRVEEPPQRGAQPARAVPQGGAEGDDRLLAARGRTARASSTAPA
jgi:hypothetical protein